MISIYKIVSITVSNKKITDIIKLLWIQCIIKSNQ